MGLKTNEYNVQTTVCQTVSVVIAARNESEHISDILNDLKIQSYPDFEVIVVDDHSDDSTADICRSFSSDLKISILTNPGCGKKDAVAFGIKSSSGSVIMTTDADCRVSCDWLSSMYSSLISSGSCLSVGPVDMVDHNCNSLFCRLQRLEFMSLQASSASAILRHRPIMCSAANLCFYKSIYDNSSFNGQSRFSGDDIFFLHYIKRLSLPVSYGFSSSAIVRTLPNRTLREFISQRARWSGKSNSYRDLDTIIVALIVLLCNVSLITLPFMSLFYPTAIMWSTIAFLLKMCADYILLSTFSNKLRITKAVNISVVFILSVLYPFYVLSSIGFAIADNLKWKDRTIN